MTQGMADVSAADDVPRFQELFVPALRALQGGEAKRSRAIVSEVANALELTTGQRARQIPSGQRQYDNRLNWALSYLFQAAAVTKPSRGVYQITDRGRALLTSHPDGFRVDVLREFTEFQDFAARTRSSVPEAGGRPSSVEETEQPPFEVVSAAVARLNAEVASELVRRLRSAEPVFLEKAVLKLLVAMGYGDGSDAAVHLGGPGDGGFDGVINQDRLGIGRVYVQAKRYAEDNIVGRPAVQGFVGALHHAGAAGGVIITTSRFSPDAVEFARSITPRVVLIDGLRLGELMVRHGVGVQDRQIFRVVETDDDFFEDV